jgi:hypothetical protein
MPRADFWSGLFLLGVAVLICAGAIRLEIGTPGAPAPGFFPLVAGLALGLLSFLILVPAWKKAEREKKFWLRGADKRGILLTFALLIGYALSLEALGFFGTNFLFFLLIGRLAAHRRWRAALAYSVLASAGIELVFRSLFNTPLPAGILPWLKF